MIYTTTTSTPIETIKLELETKANESGFGLLHSYAFKEILEGKGFPIEKDITVFELCNPSGAQQALIEIPAISAYLPCRLSLYQEDGVTIIATIGFEDILNAIGESERFKDFMTTLFENLKIVMHSWDD